MGKKTCGSGGVVQGEFIFLICGITLLKNIPD